MIALLLFVMACAAAPVGPAVQTPGAWIEAQAAAVRALNADESLDPKVRAARLLKLALEAFDAEGFAAAALRRVWPDLAPAERAELVAGIETSLVERYVGHLAGQTSYSLEVRKWEQRGGVVVVHCAARADERSNAAVRALSFVLTAGSEGSLRVLDVVIDEVSLLRNYRSAYSKALRTGGLPRLRAVLAHRRPAEGAGASEEHRGEVKTKTH